MAYLWSSGVFLTSVDKCPFHVSAPYLLTKSFGTAIVPSLYPGRNAAVLATRKHRVKKLGDYGLTKNFHTYKIPNRNTWKYPNLDRILTFDTKKTGS